MLNSKYSLPRLCSTVVITLGCALGSLVLQLPALRAADAPASKASADAPAAPLTATFEKVAGAESAPYVLKLKNDSKDSLKVSAKVLLAVASHAESKARLVPEHGVKAGETWTVPNLAAEDKVTVVAKGFAPLELVVK